MGINPGEPGNEKITYPRVNDLLEEASEYDYLANDKKSKPATRWKNRCGRACGTLDIASTEAFFWSSKDVKKLSERWDTKKHRDFCVELNKELIEIHNPKAVMFTGISYIEEIALHYNLIIEGQSILNDKGQRLIVPYKDKSGRPWLFVKHFSSWIRNSELDCIGDYVRRTT